MTLGSYIKGQKEYKFTSDGDVYTGLRNGLRIWTSMLREAAEKNLPAPKIHVRAEGEYPSATRIFTDMTCFLEHVLNTVSSTIELDPWLKGKKITFTIENTDGLF